MTVAPVEVIIPAQNDDLLDPGAHTSLSREQARRITDQIRTSANRLWVLVYVAHQRKAWRALGYDSWKTYVAEELGLSESRSFQLVDTGKVMMTIAAAVGTSPEQLDPVPARTVARVKDKLPALRKAIAAALAEGSDAELHEVMTAAVEEVAPKPVPEQKKKSSVLVECPVCLGEGYLGTGRQAQDLAERASRWLKRVFG